jgi:hypothetical protein
MLPFRASRNACPDTSISRTCSNTRWSAVLSGIATPRAAAHAGWDALSPSLILLGTCCFVLRRLAARTCSCFYSVPSSRFRDRVPYVTFKICPCVQWSQHYIMKTYWAMGVTSALEEGTCTSSTSRLGRFTPGSHLADSRAGLDAAKCRKITCPYSESNPGGLVLSPSLHQMSGPASYTWCSQCQFERITNNVSKSCGILTF